MLTTSHAGLLNADDAGFTGALVRQAAADLEAALAAGARPRPRMLLRLLAALAVVNVVHAGEVLALLEALVRAAVSIAEAGEC